jgi:hypothetical protein
MRQIGANASAGASFKEHVCIEPRSPQLNGKVEWSHRTDKDEFQQLLTY